MRKRHFRYYCRMIVKTTLLLLPLLIIIFLSFSANVTNESYLLIQVSNVFEGLQDSPMNQWYFDFVRIVGYDNWFGNTSISTILICLPLYFIWVEIFDLLLHLVLFIPDLFHKWLGGDK